MRIWAKTVKDLHTEKEITYEREGKLVYSHLLEYLMEICPALDIPTPVLLKPHIMDFAKFRHVRFRAGDFVEQINFDFLWIENIE